MEVSVESAEGLQRRIRVQIPSQRFEQAVDEKVRRVGQHAKLPGFRPGKIPIKVLYQRYGEAARAEVTNELVQSSYPEALAQVQLKPAGQPKVELGEEAGGQGLSFTAEFEVFPEIELQGLDGLAVTRPVAEVTDGDIDRTIENMREQRKEFTAVEREAREQDQVRIDYQGKLDGEAFEGGSGEDVEMILGAGRFLPDLEQAVYGHVADDAFDVAVTFPEDYDAEDLAGRQADFHIRVKQVSEPHLPKVDDEFLKQFGIEEGGEDALREKIRESLAREAEQVSDSRVKTQIMEGLHKANPIDVPQAVVAREIDTMRRETNARLGRAAEQDEDKLRELLPDETLREPAQRRAALGLLLAEVIAKRNIKLDPEKVDAHLDAITAGHEQAEQVKGWYRSQSQMMQGVEAMVMEGQVIEALVADAKVEEQKVTLDDLMKERDS